MNRIQYDTLYKRDSKGNLRIWRMEQDGDRYRTSSGLKDGARVTTEWTTAEPKNVGRSNATTGEEQAQLEIEAAYTLKLRKDYHRLLKNVDVQKFVKPMLAKDYAKRSDKIDWSAGVYVQPKLDGIRCIANADGLWTRTGKPIESCPHIIEALAPLFEQHPELTLDGELYNHDLKDDFNEIVSLVRKAKPKQEHFAKTAGTVQYHIYDMITDEPFSKRQGFLGNSVYVIGLNPVETTLVHSEAECDEEYGTYIERGYEGGIIRLDGPYEQKRSSLLLKRKDFEDAEFEIIEVLEGQGNWSGVAKVVRCLLEDGREFKATIKGTREYCAEVLVQKDSYIGKQATVQFFTRTPDGIPRFPIAKQLHDDERI